METVAEEDITDHQLLFTNQAVTHQELPCAMQDTFLLRCSKTHTMKILQLVTIVKALSTGTMEEVTIALNAKLIFVQIVEWVEKNQQAHHQVQGSLQWIQEWCHQTKDSTLEWCHQIKDSHQIKASNNQDSNSQGSNSQDSNNQASSNQVSNSSNSNSPTSEGMVFEIKRMYSLILRKI